MQATPTNIVPALVVCLVLWSVVRRVRRNVGRQTMRPKRMMFRILFFCVITMVLAAVLPHEPRFMLALGGGFIGGVLLGLLGLRLTHFERTGDDCFYTPNPYLGAALSLLFVGRLIYRLTLLHAAAEGSEYKASQLTVVMFALVAGYYITYYAGIFVRRHKWDAANASGQSGQVT